MISLFNFILFCVLSLSVSPCFASSSLSQKRTSQTRFQALPHHSKEKTSLKEAPLKEKDLLIFPFGFTLSLKNSPWKPLSLGETSPPSVFYSSSSNSSNETPHFDAYLTVRTQYLRERPIKVIQEEWEKDFFYAGFDILESRRFKTFEDKKGFLFDLKFKPFRIYQLIFFKSMKVVYLTCYAHFLRFHRVFESCKHMARGFHWLTSSPPLHQ